MKSNSKKPRIRRIRRGSVLVISSLLLSSAILRLVSSGALAEDTEVTREPSNSLVAFDANNTGISTQLNLDRSGMEQLLESLQLRESRLAEQERQMALRIKALSVADEEITQRLSHLEEAETRLSKTLALADGAAEGDLARLTTVYETMKPKDTAALFEMMEPDFAAGFLGRMHPEAAAAVMTGLSPDVAYSISVIIAGRNANAPKT